MNKKTVIITPLANEEATILSQIEAVASLKIDGLEAVFVLDNYSKDKTRSIIESASHRYPWVHLEFFKGSTGVVSCYLYGLKKALALGADHVVEMDGGLSHDPMMIPLFIQKLNEGYDCVFGSRFLKGGGFDGLPWHRYALSHYGTVLANIVLGTKLSDMTSGYEAFRREVLLRIDPDDFLALSTTHFYQTEMRYYCHRLKVCELPIVFHGSSTSLKSGEVARSLSALGRLRQRKPLKAGLC